MDQIEQLKNIIKESNSIVFFGGAGVSTESGIPDFRSVDGLYHMKYKYPPEEILSRTFFQKHVEEFYEFYWDKMIYPDVKPNQAHFALAKLEQEGKLKAIITQNIDGLHQMAGSKNVLELHGSIHRNHCIKCHKFYSLNDLQKEGVPHCECGGIIKPDVVLYEEALNEQVLTKSVHAIENADLLMIGGTSLNVYPAAGLIDYFHGKYMVEINMSATAADSRADLVIKEPIGKVLSNL